MASYDVMVIGGGAAALCAALAARRYGVRVCLVEQAPYAQRGGNTRHARNFRFSHEQTNHFTAGAYPATEFAADLRRATAPHDTELAAQLVAQSATLLDWCATLAIPLQRIDQGALPASRRTAFLLGGGMTMMNQLYRDAEQAGIAIYYGTQACAPRVHKQRLEQLCLVSPDGTYSCIKPRMVILCCGGGQADRTWWRRCWGQAARSFVNRGTPFATGALLNDFLHQGMQPVGHRDTAYFVAVDARSPNDDGGIVTRVRCMPEGVVVDAEGQRRDDEGADTASTRYARWGQRLTTYPDGYGYLILDARGQRCAPPSLYPPIQAPTIANLANQLRLSSGHGLQHTIASYNAATTRNKAMLSTPQQWVTESLKPPKSQYAYPIQEAPYFAYPLCPGITFTYYGLAVDHHLRLLNQQQQPIKNVFAAGMIMAPNIMPQGYLSGLALTIGLVFGRQAGEQAAQLCV
jgi:tricarballylate dehydrogenase